MLEWLENWFLSQCDGDWEHSHGVEITTLDNPGWEISVDFSGTELCLQNQKWILNESSDEDWYGYKIEEGVFNAAGDPKKLSLLISIFKGYVEL